MSILDNSSLIVKNTEFFKREYGVKKESSTYRRPNRNGSIGVLFDHVRVYLCNDGRYMCTTSPYKHSSYNLDDQATLLGMKKYRNLYNKITNTYIKEFRSLKEYINWVRETHRLEFTI